MGWVRRLYDWVLGWADTPYGAPALFILAFAESSFFPIPPDVLLIALAVAVPTRAFRFALICTAGSVAGGVAGYAIGVYGWEAIGKPIVDAYHGQPVMDKIQAWYSEYGFWGTLAAAITPIPYKVFTLASGVFSINFSVFVLASVLSRGLRFFLVAALVYHFGPAIERFITLHFNRLAICFGVLFLVGFLAIEFLL